MGRAAVCSREARRECSIGEYSESHYRIVATLTDLPRTLLSRWI